MSVTRKEMLEIQEAERMRRLNVICAGLASRKSWKEIAAELKTTVPAVRTCWYRYKHLIPAQDPTEQPDEPQNGHEELVDNQDIPRMTPEILKTLSAFQTEYWFSDWKARTPGDILTEAIHDGNAMEIVKTMKEQLRFLKNNLPLYPRNAVLIEAVQQALDLWEYKQLPGQQNCEIPVSTEPWTLENESASVKGSAHLHPEQNIMNCNEFDMSRRCNSMTELVPHYRTHYLVDTENVNGAAIYELLRSIGDNDALHLFYTDESSNLPFGALEIILQRQKQVHLEHCTNGEKNALDAQIVSAMGFMIAFCEPDKQEFIIVSKDHGYDPVIRFWLTKGIRARREKPYCDGKKTKTKSTIIKSATTLTKSTTIPEVPKTVHAADQATVYYKNHPEKRTQMRQLMACYMGAEFKKYGIKIGKFGPVMEVLFQPSYQESDFSGKCEKQAAAAIMKLDLQTIMNARQNILKYVKG